MPVQFDRRAVAAALAAFCTGAGRSPNLAELAEIVDPANGPAMACAGLIVRRADGSVAVQAATGSAPSPSGPRAFTLAAPFRVASVSKMIAALGFVPLALRQGYDLDGDVSAMLGFALRHPAYPDTPITARMLLSHTSGLRNGASYPVPLGVPLAEAFRPGGHCYDDGAWFGPVEHRPGDWFAYADVNFALIAQLLERIAERRFDLHMRQVVFEPLGLDIGYNWSGVSARKRAQAAAGVRRLDGRWTAQVDAQVPAYPAVAAYRTPESRDATVDGYRPGENGFVFAPQGGLRLNLRDMDRLARTFAAGGTWQGREIAPREAVELIQTRHWAYDFTRPNGEAGGVFHGYGLGVQVPLGRAGASGDAFFGDGTGDWRGHLGDAYGWMTGLFWNRRDGRTLVYALNGMAEVERPPALRSSLTGPEEALIDLALTASA